MGVVERDECGVEAGVCGDGPAVIVDECVVLVFELSGPESDGIDGVFERHAGDARIGVVVRIVGGDPPFLGAYESGVALTVCLLKATAEDRAEEGEREGASPIEALQVGDGVAYHGENREGDGGDGQGLEARKGLASGLWVHRGVIERRRG